MAKPVGKHKWIGRGTAAVANGQLSINGARHRMFRSNIDQTVTYQFADIQNVVVYGSRMLMSLRTAEGKEEWLQLWAEDEQAAALLSDALPTTRTHEFECQLAEAKAFAAQLQSLPPRRYVTEFLLGANLQIFLMTLWAGANFLTGDPAVLIAWGSNFAIRTVHGEWWRLITATFLHIGFVHLALNMWSLWLFGRLAERLYGSPRFLLLYLSSGLIGNMASIWWNPQVHSAGASGAVFGIFGGLLACMVNPSMRIQPTVARTQLRSLAVLVLVNIGFGLSVDGIDNAAHVGGLLGGFVMGWLLVRPIDAKARRYAAHPLGVMSAGLGTAIVLVSWITFIGNRSWTPEERAFLTLAREAMDVDARMSQRADKLSSSVRSGVLSEPTAGRLMADEVSGTLRTEINKVEDALLSDESDLQSIRIGLIDYLGSRRLGTELLGEAAQDRDADKVMWAMQVLERGNARQKLIEQQLAIFP